MVSDKERAVQQATQAVRDIPRDPARYDIETTETGDEWEIRFLGKPPRPPGDEVTVLIDKRSGARRLMQGE